MCQNFCNSAQLKAGNVKIKEGMTLFCRLSEYFVCIFRWFVPAEIRNGCLNVGDNIKKNIPLVVMQKYVVDEGRCQSELRAAGPTLAAQQSGSLHQRGEDEGQNWARSRLDPGNIFTALVAGRVLCCCAPGGSELDRNCKLKLQRSLNLTCKMGCDLAVTLVSQEGS